MKKCPTCEKTFDDNMRFCQTDGTALVAVEEPVDLYKTMVAKPEDIAAAMSGPGTSEPPKKEEEGEVLQVPEVAPPPAAEIDPKKTMYASEAEIRKAMAEVSEEPVMEIPPYSEPAEPPKFDEPQVAPPSFTEPGPPPSPFAAGEPAQEPTRSAIPIPSPFDQPQPEASPSGQAPMASPFEEPAAPANIIDPMPAADPASPLAPTEWTPPSDNVFEPQQQLDMQNPQFSQGGAPAAGQNTTLAIISLVVGILSLLCCAWFVPAIVAIVLGFMARGKANSDPMNYGGAGLALGGIICGGVSLLLGVIVLVLYFLGFAASMMGNIG